MKRTIFRAIHFAPVSASNADLRVTQEKFKMIDTRLRDITLQHLRSRPRDLTLQQIADSTGLPKTWLEKFSQDKTDHPSVNYVLTLYQHLTKTKVSLIAPHNVT